MPTLKNTLLSTPPYQTKRIIELLKYTETHYREDNAPKLYDEVLLSSRKDKGMVSDDFLELIYETLKAFNMDTKGAKLSELSVFKRSIKKHAQTIQSLVGFKLEKVKKDDRTLAVAIPALFNLFDDHQLVQTESPLVTFSKTMHFLLPDLFMPIDRKFTLQFFYSRPPYKKVNYGLYHLTNTLEKQKECFLQVFEQFRQFAHTHSGILKEQVDKNSRWNRNIPKVIDNIIIAYERENME